MPLLVISDSDDAHLPFVTKHLGEAPLVIGSKGLMDDEGLDIFTTPADEMKIHYGGVELTRPESVWYRKPHFALLDELHHVDPSHRGYVDSAIKTYLSNLYPLLESSFWVSDYPAIQRANSKPLQINLAKRLGFNVPETLFTSSAKSAASFLQSHGASIVKSTASVYPADAKAGTAQFFFARKIEKGEGIDLSGLDLAPAIFQEAVDTDFDIRVTVIGTRVFAAAIRISNVEQKFAKTLDWRTGGYDGELDFTPFTLPPRIADLCIRHVADLGLRFGAIDLVQDKRGKIWFLENNPNGQWAFVEEVTGQPIGKALARLLETREP